MGGDDYSNICFEVAQGTLPWQPILGTRSAKLAYPPVFLHSLHWHSETGIAMLMHALTAVMICLHPVESILEYTGTTFTKF